MKMKDAIVRTGLTDRAIRLYIDAGLLAPQIKKNYEGRKNLTFSEADLETLGQIALLRKAGFSLEQIRQIEESPEQAAAAVADLLRQKEEEQALNEQVIEALSALPRDAVLTLPLLAEKLETGFSSQPVPEADLRLPLGERIARALLLTIAAVGILGALIPSVTLGYALLRDFRFPVPDPDWPELLPTDIFYLFCVLAALACGALLCFSLKKQVWQTGGKKGRRALSLLLTAVMLGADLSIALLTGVYAFAPGIHSETNDPAHYLETDESVREKYDLIYKIFPAEIPYEAVDIRYFYRNMIDHACTDVFAEWRLPGPRPPCIAPEDSYGEEKSRLLSLPGVLRTEQKGKWTCCWLTDDPQDWVSAECMFFAYRDDIRAVRYYYSESNFHYLPWYLNDLKWD